MDAAEEAPTCSEQSIESAVAETASSDGQLEVQPIGDSLKANIDDEQIQTISSVSGDQIMTTDTTPNDQPQGSSGSAPESSSMNDAEQNGKEGNDEDDMDSMSEISDFSDFSQESWHPVQGPIAWVQEQMRQGQSARSILEDLVPPGTMIPDDIDPIMMWRLIINIVSEPPKRKKLESINTLEDVISLMKSCNKIIVLTGAGVSVSCGIPDFRSRDGVYARLAVDFPNLPDPQAMFDIHFFRSDPRPFFKFAKEIYPGQFKPSLCHHFIRLIESQGKLLRNYTQNIDTLEQEAGIERVVQCHGSFATATCTNCKLKVKSDDVREDIFKQVIPKCPQCPEGTENAIMKPDIVFFGESLPEDFHKQMAQDKDECDLLIVIGSSLKVRPVALIPNSVSEHVPQILINRERLSYLNFDVELLGNCDDIVGELCHRLGTGWDQLAPPDVSPLTEVNVSDLPTPPSSPQSQHPASSSPSTSTVKHEETTATDVKNNEESSGEPSVAPEQSTSSSSKTNTASTEANKEGKADNDGDIKMESEQGPVSCVDCSSSKAELQTTASVVDCDRGDCPGNGTKPGSSSSSKGESVSSSNLPPTSDASAEKVHKEGNSVAGNALFDEVSTTTSAEAKAHPRLSDDESRATDKGNAESDIVSSTSNEHMKVHHHHSHHHHHKHSHHHHPHHNHHEHHHYHHRHGHHHHHHHSSSSGKSPSKDHPENGNGLDTMEEPVEKRPRLEVESEASATLVSNAGGDNESMTSAMATGSQQIDGQAGMFDDELEEMRKMWQGRKNKVSLAQRLAENQYLFLPPNRYVFKGAEVFSESEEDDSDSEGSSEDEETKENNDENSNDISTETEEQQDEGQQVVEICDASAGVKDVAGDVPSLSKPSAPVVGENVNVKDTPGDVSSTNCEKQDCGASLSESQ